MNVCYACGREVSWAWEYICPTHGKGVMICTQERWNELQELRRLLRIEDAARKMYIGGYAVSDEMLSALLEKK